MTDAIAVQGGVFALLLGVLAGRLVGGAYFAALGWSVRRFDRGAGFLAIGAVVRLAIVAASISVATVINVGAAVLVAATFGFLLARHAAIAPLLHKRRARP